MSGASQRVWSPGPAAAQSRMAQFRARAEKIAGKPLDGTAALHAWSLADPGAFWALVFEFFDIAGSPGTTQLQAGERFQDMRFLPEARLNFAETLLRHTGPAEAIIYRGEDGERLHWSRDALRATVSQIQQAMRAAGVKPGDRVAGFLPNRPEAVAIMLAAVSLGAIWSSASPDFGASGVLDRFGQIEPVLLFAADGYHYAGKRIDIRSRLKEIAAQLPSARRIIVLPVLGLPLPEADPRMVSLSDFVVPFRAAAPVFERFPFDHPLCILFSSGTTGKPKCIIHRAGGVLLQHLKELALHSDVREGDRVFYFTTLGWMMWNWLVSSLALGATLLLYDGSPFHPDAMTLPDYIADERATLFGVSAKYVDQMRKLGVDVRAKHALPDLRTLCSTGSPLLEDGFDYVYSAIKPDVHLASISGGTDIVSCFVLGDPTRPVYRGQIQGPGLGLAIEVRRLDGSRADTGEKGELVCAAPFPCMPLGFWNDPDGKRYSSAYFERMPGVWHHGDFIEETAEGGYIIHGRSDATLNPGGVRIGTAEIYAQVEKLPEVIEALAVGRDIPGDVEVVLFVRLKPQIALDDDLVQRLKSAIRSGATPRHVPARIVAAPDFPRTKSGKISELAVRDIIHGRSLGNVEALANAEALAFFGALKWA
jgi:acetoacetyl-CoA synthetase